MNIEFFLTLLNCWLFVQRQRLTSPLGVLSTLFNCWSVRKTFEPVSPVTLSPAAFIWRIDEEVFDTELSEEERSDMVDVPVLLLLSELRGKIILV